MGDHKASNLPGLLLDAIMKKLAAIQLDGTIRVKVLGMEFELNFPRFEIPIQGGGEERESKIDIKEELSSFSKGQCFCFTGKCAILERNTGTGGSCYTHSQCQSKNCDTTTYTCAGTL